MISETRTADANNLTQRVALFPYFEANQALQSERPPTAYAKSMLVSATRSESRGGQ